MYQKTVVEIPKAKVEEPIAPVVSWRFLTLALMMPFLTHQNSQGSTYQPVSKTLPEPKQISPSSRFTQAASSDTANRVAEERAKREKADREAREREAAKSSSTSVSSTEARASTGDEARRARDAELEAIRKARGSNEDVSSVTPKDDRSAREVGLGQPGTDNSEN